MAILFLLALVPLLPAQTAEPLSAIATVLKAVTTADGHEDFVDASQADAGDILVYRAVYKNNSSRDLREVAAILPVPPGLTYQAGSARPAPHEASLDGKTFFPVQTPPAGVKPEAWRVVRWAPQDLAAGAMFAVELRARVNPAVVSSAPAAAR